MTSSPDAVAPTFRRAAHGSPFRVAVRNREFLAGSAHDSFPESVPDAGELIPTFAAEQADCPSPVLATDEQGPLWTRRYSDDKSAIDCAGLGEALRALDAKRMVVGHTVHEEGISSACDGRVWRIDTGLSKMYGGPMQVLQIQGDAVTVLKGRP